MPISLAQLFDTIRFVAVPDTPMALKALQTLHEYLKVSVPDLYVRSGSKSLPTSLSRSNRHDAPNHLENASSKSLDENISNFQASIFELENLMAQLADRPCQPSHERLEVLEQEVRKLYEQNNILQEYLIELMALIPQGRPSVYSITSSQEPLLVSRNRSTGSSDTGGSSSKSSATGTGILGGPIVASPRSIHLPIHTPQWENGSFLGAGICESPVDMRSFTLDHASKERVPCLIDVCGPPRDTLVLSSSLFVEERLIVEESLQSLIGETLPGECALLDDDLD